MAATIPKRKPRVVHLSGKSLVFALDGIEQPYPVYRFSSKRAKYERPKHNPFAGL